MEQIKHISNELALINYRIQSFLQILQQTVTPPDLKMTKKEEAAGNTKTKRNKPTKRTSVPHQCMVTLGERRT